MQVAFLIGDLPVPHEVAVYKAPQTHGSGVVVRYFVAQQVTGLHAHNRSLNHAYVVFTNAAGVRDGGDQIEPIIFVAQSFNRFRIGKSGDDIFGYQPEPAVGIRKGTVDLPKTGFDSDRTQLLPVIVEQERLGAVFKVRQTVLGEVNNLPEGGVLLSFVPHGSGTFPGTQKPREGNELRG